ncbi:GGDEF domain-containing protein [Pseudoalteromonas sp. P1-8]|uniref:GGDEF domain-containing protein n=1 Tax=Pseudoalteromonas sp. P1-8 TaxID=1710353 RepID=UPI000BA43ADD|nr:GGDEF domain-containing protein [Pseudoalteromonas sp. P1-8]
MASNVENYFYHGFFVFLLITVVTCSIIATRLMRSSFNNRSIYLFNLFFYLGVIGFAWLWIQDLLDLTPSFRSGVVIYMISMTLLQLSIYNHDEPSRFNKIIIAHGAIFSVFALLTQNINQLALVEACFTLSVLPALIYFTTKRAVCEKNIGNTVLSMAQCILLLVPISQLSIITHEHNLATLYSLTVIAHATVFVMTGLGLITTLLVDEKKRYLELSLKDPLTGLYNRRGLQFIIEQQQLFSPSQTSSLFACVVDIDYFKRINDSYGHDGGDLVLEVFSDLMKHHLKKEDLCCRLGGEEFLLLFFATDISSAKQFLEGLRKTFETSQIAYREHRISVTASFGLTNWQPNDSFESLVNRADKAVYAAKNNGRNRIETNSLNKE